MRKTSGIMVLLLALGFSAEVVTFDNNWAKNPLFNMVSETPDGVEIIFSIHEMVVEETLIDDIPMKNFGIPGIFLFNEEGAPNLAGTGRYIAVPQGARVEVTILDSRTEVYHNIEVAPAPNIPIENDDAPLRYVKDMSIYGQNAYYPLSPVELSKPTKIRGVDVVLLGIIPFQYNPVAKDLIIYKDIRIKIDFIGGNGHFGEDRLRSRFWEPILQGHLLNYKSLPKIDFYNRSRGRYGFEYIIIVPDDPVFEAWADTIKLWRILQGISCEVFNLTDIGGNDTIAIENFLNNAYNTWDPAPAAFLLLSDYQSSGVDVYGITTRKHRYDTYICVADNKYADVNNNYLPDIHHARICAQDQTDLATMINKFLSYERAPYTEANFYEEPLVSCAWEADRWFQICAEVIRGFFINIQGRNPARQYEIYIGNPYAGCPWSTAANTATVVNYFYNLGYIPLTNPYDYSWWNNSTATGITDAINSGAFIIQHRDHGMVTGWFKPNYETNHLNNLSNDMYCFVFTTNCLTGKYNMASECFTEKFHKIQYGALGLNAATEVSFSFTNDTYVWGIYDCLWQEFMPDYPAYDMTGYNNLRPCQAMTYGKYFLSTSNWVYNSTAKIATYMLFHHHGDCFEILYSEIPESLTVSHDSLLPAEQTYFTVTADDSSVIALTVNYEIIGVAEGTGTPIDIPIPAQYPSDTMIVTITKANYYRHAAKVPVVDAGMPENPIIVKPLDFARVPDTQPSLGFYSNDPNNDDIQYRILWDTDPSFASPESSTTASYPSGSVVNFTFPAPLADGATYWYKVKCNDPAGSGYWTQYTTKRSFTIGTSLPQNSCSWFQTTAAQFGFNTFNGTVIQGDSITLAPNMTEFIVDTIFEEDFEAGGIPAGWTVINGNGDAVQWTVGTTADLGSYVPPNYGTRYAYYSDHNAGGGVVNYNEELISPAVHIPGLGVRDSLEIIYGYGFRRYQAGEVFDVRARFFSGGAWGAWNTIASYTTSDSGTAVIDLTPYLPADSVQFDWMYYDDASSFHYGFACACDNVLLRYIYALLNDYGTVTSVGVSYHDLAATYARFHWGNAVWRKASAGDSLGIQVEYYDSGWQLVPEGVLPGNASGFYTSIVVDSVHLNTLDTLTYHTLRLVGLFYRKSTDAPNDPALLDWELGNLTNYGISINEHQVGINIIEPNFKVYPSVNKSRFNIFFALGNPEAQVDLKIYDAIGRLVKQFNHLTNSPSLCSQGRGSPINQIIWQGDDNLGRRVSTGVYFIKFETDGYKKIEKAVFLR